MTKKNVTEQDAIEFVQALSAILCRDHNATSAWEIYCTNSYLKVCNAIYAFTTATEKQKAEAWQRVWFRRQGKATE
jgi:hypothetical protein